MTFRSHRLLPLISTTPPPSCWAAEETRDLFGSRRQAHPRRGWPPAAPSAVSSASLSLAYEVDGTVAATNVRYMIQIRHRQPIATPDLRGPGQRDGRVEDQ